MRKLVWQIHGGKIWIGSLFKIPVDIGLRITCDFWLMAERRNPSFLLRR
jgi:hypothetical protein